MHYFNTPENCHRNYNHTLAAEQNNIMHTQSHVKIYITTFLMYQQVTTELRTKKICM